jgi:hypothetical protein
MAKIKNKPKPLRAASANAGSITETCSNPWNGSCENTDIALYIMYRGERIPLCWECWIKISRKNIEWEAY